MNHPDAPEPDHRRPTGAGGASGSLSDHDRARVRAVLARAQELGFLGPATLEPQIDHAVGFARAAGAPPALALDLGSGGGLPSLVLALCWPSTRWVLVEAMEKRAVHLSEAVASLGLADRVTIDHRRAEDVGRDPSRRASHDLVTARSFGPPAAVAECGAPLLQRGGRLVVSDPPEGPGDRWPAEVLATLGLAVEGSTDGCTVLRCTELTPDRFPRRNGIPAKRPLYRG